MSLKYIFSCIETTVGMWYHGLVWRCMQSLVEQRMRLRELGRTVSSRPGELLPVSSAPSPSWLVGLVVFCQRPFLLWLECVPKMS